LFQYLENLHLVPFHWILFALCGILIGISKTGLSGAGLIAVPIMASLFGGKISTGIVLPMLIFADIFAVIYYHRHASWRYIWLLVPWAIIGIILGTIFGNRINDAQFKITLAIIIFCGVTVVIWHDLNKKSFQIPDKWWLAAILGLIGGFVTMVGNASGPIMSLYLLSMRLPKNNFIGTGAWFFLIINLLKIPFHLFSWRTINLNSFSIDLLAIPAILLGIFIGIKLVKYLNEKAYRILIIASTVIAAVLLI
jgi:uncharacterized membrane protein YfcA